MLKQDIITLIARLIPEAFLIICSIYLLTKSKIDMKRILVSSIIGGMGVYILRTLPIHFGVHTILAILWYIFLAVIINKINTYKAITVTLASMIILFISDFLLVVIYTKVFKLSSEVLFGKGLVANIIGLPSLVLFYIIVRLIVCIRKRRWKWVILKKFQT